MKDRIYNHEGVTVREAVEYLQQFPEDAKIYRISNEERNNTAKAHEIFFVPPELQTVNGEAPETTLPVLIVIN